MVIPSELLGEKPPKSWFGVVTGLLGIFFLFVDIGSDVWLAYEYHQDAVFYRTFPIIDANYYIIRWEVGALFHYEKDTYSEKKFPGISRACAEQYLCMNYGKNTKPPTAYCRDEIRDAIGLPPPQHQLDTAEASLHYMWATLCVIALGSIMQTATATILACRGKLPSKLPMFVKVLTLIFCPVLMGPVVVTAYLVVCCAKGITEEDEAKYKILVGTLKMGEIIFESLPQLTINSLSLLYKCSKSKGFKHVYSQVPIVKWLSISTSTLAISYSIADWIMKKKKKFFISPKHHPLSSFVGLFVWAVSLTLSLFTSIINVNLAIKEQQYVDWSIKLLGLYFPKVPGIVGGGLTMYIISAVTFIASILVISSACTKKPCCRRFNLCISISYLLLITALMGLITHIYFISRCKALIATLAFGYTHLLLGILILPAPCVGATIFDPFPQQFGRDDQWFTSSNMM